jgi:hypothetical protein
LGVAVDELALARGARRSRLPHLRLA